LPRGNKGKEFLDLLVGMIFFKLEFIHDFIEVIMVKSVLHARIPIEQFLIGLKTVD
jgi:hypothetical protein